MKKQFIVSIFFLISFAKINAQCKGVSFQNNDDFVSYTDVSFTFSNALTVEAYVNITYATLVGAPLMGQSLPGDNSPNSISWNWQIAGGNSFMFVVNDAGTFRTAVSNTLSLGWHYIATVANNSSLSIYIDGALDVTSSPGITNSVYVNPVSSIYLGQDPSTFFNGLMYNANYMIADFRLWNVARTLSQITTNSNVCLPSNSPGLLQYSQFEEGWGSMVAQPITGALGHLVNMQSGMSWIVSPNNGCCTLSCAPNVSLAYSGPTLQCSPSTLVVGAIASPSYQSGTGWYERADFPGGPRSAAVSFTVGSKAYYGLGSWSLNDLWEYDPSNNTWTQKANFPPGIRISACSFGIGSKGYVCCGFDGSTLNKRDLWEYDPALNVWTQMADLGGSIRREAACFTIGNKGYVTTGRDATYFNDLWEYNPSNNTWTQKANFAGIIRSAATGVSSSTLGLLGFGNDGANYINDLWAYDAVSDTWSQKSTMPSSIRNGVSGFAINNKTYFVCGQSANLLKEVWEYDLSADTWVKKKSFPGYNKGFGSAVVLNNKAYFGLGSGYGYVTKDFWSFNPDYYSYLWMPGNVITNTLAILNSGDYTVTVTSLMGCTTSAVASASINPSPTINLSTSNNTICPGNSSTITASGANTYTWNNGPNGNSIVVTPSISTLYIVNGTSTNGCQSNSLILQTVVPCIGMTETQIDNLTSVKIFPNPTTSNFTVESNKPIEIFIYNSIGQIIYQEKIKELKSEISLADFSKGLYFITIGTEVQKIIKE